MTEFAESALRFTDLAGETWGSFRLQVGSEDVTNFRDVPAQIAGYQLVEPYSYGPADFNLPQLSIFEVDQWGTGDLSWFGEGKPVRLKHVDADGTTVRIVWRGFVAVTSVTLQGTQIHCEGDSTGRLGLRNKLSEVFALKRPVGYRLYESFQFCGLNLSPAYGGNIGSLTDGRGFTGSHLDYCDFLLSQTIQLDGSQHTIRAKATGGYELVEKDTTTVGFTAFVGVHGVDPDLSSDIAEKPNYITGSGIAPNGLSWANVKLPNAQQGTAPDYPMTDDSSFGEGTTDADTDSGDGVSVMVAKLAGTDYLARKDRPGGYDDDAVAAVKALQDDAGLSETGVMNPATWRALFDLDVTGVSLKNAHIAPLAQSPKVHKWNQTANGSRLSRNPDYDPSVIVSDLNVDHGTSVELADARRWSKGVLHRAATTKNWSGTVTFTTDVFSGSVQAADVDLASKVMSRLDIVEGSNLMLRNFDGDTLFHVAGVNVTVDEGNGAVVSVAVDTQGRDAPTLGEVLDRNIESRSNAFRSWKRQRGSNVNLRQIEFSEASGLIWNKIDLPGEEWTVFEVFVGQAGYVSRVRIQTESDPAAFFVGITAQRVGRSWYNQHIGDPRVTNSHGESKWTNPSIQHTLDSQRAVVGAWGSPDQPCGYFPRQKTNAQGETTDAPITGLFLDDGGFDYHTVIGSPVLYVAVYPDRDTVIKPQRILWDLYQSSAS